METNVASPKAKILEEIYVRGQDKIIRISENAVIVTTTRKEGITLPEDVNPEGASAKQEYVSPEGGQTVEDNNGVSLDVLGRIISDDDLMTLSQNIEEDWRALALCHLDIPATEVETISQQTATLPDQIFRMLSFWRTSVQRPVTVGDLIAKLEKAIDKKKWEFLIQSEQSDEEEDDDDEPAASEQDDEAPTNIEDREEALSAESETNVSLPPSSFNNILNDVTHAGTSVHETENLSGRQADNEPVNDAENQYVYHTIVSQAEEQADEGDIHNDIDRICAVYTGFAEDKKDYFTSLGTSLGDVMQKILRLDLENKQMKTENAELKQSRTESAFRTAKQEQTRPRDATRKAESKEGTHRHRYTEEEFKRQRENYLKMKRQLKEAVDANREWETFSRGQRDKFQKETQEKTAIIRSLEDQVKTVQYSSTNQDRQMDSILNATESQVAEIQKKLERMETENRELKEKLQRMAEEKRKVEKLSKDLLKESTRPGIQMKPRMEIDERQDDYMMGHFTASLCDPVMEDSYHEVMRMAATQARAPPNDPPNVLDQFVRQENRPEKARGSSKLAKKSPGSPTDDDIFFLKQQIIQYQQDFDKERADREKAVGDLESLRRQLEDTKLMLSIQRDEHPPRHPPAAQRETKPKKKAFPYMGPDEVADYRIQSGAYDDHRQYKGVYDRPRKY